MTHRAPSASAENRAGRPDILSVAEQPVWFRTPKPRPSSGSTAELATADVGVAAGTTCSLAIRSKLSVTGPKPFPALVRTATPRPWTWGSALSIAKKPGIDPHRVRSGARCFPRLASRVPALSPTADRVDRRPPMGETIRAGCRPPTRGRPPATDLVHRARSSTGAHHCPAGAIPRLSCRAVQHGLRDSRSDARRTRARAETHVAGWCDAFRGVGGSQFGWRLPTALHVISSTNSPRIAYPTLE